MPPDLRNHLEPTGGDTPASRAASSLERPVAIAAQNRTSSSRRAESGRPGECNLLRPDRSDRRLRTVIATSYARVLRRPVELAAYHVAGPASFSRFALIRMLADRLPGPGDVIEVGLDDLSFADERPKDLSLDAAKLMAVTGLRFRDMAACCHDVASEITALHRAGTAHSWALEPESAQAGACNER